MNPNNEQKATGEGTEQTSTDCKSKVGKTVTIIDTIFFLCSLLRGRNLKSKAVVAAIKDMQGDENASYIIRKFAFTEEDMKMRETISNHVAKLKKDSPEMKYYEWLERQIARVTPLSTKAGQPKGLRQGYMIQKE